MIIVLRLHPELQSQCCWLLLIAYMKPHSTLHFSAVNCGKCIALYIRSRHSAPYIFHNATQQNILSAHIIKRWEILQPESDPNSGCNWSINCLQSCIQTAAACGISHCADRQTRPLQLRWNPIMQCTSLQWIVGGASSKEMQQKRSKKIYRLLNAALAVTGVQYLLEERTENHLDLTLYTLWFYIWSSPLFWGWEHIADCCRCVSGACAVGTCCMGCLALVFQCLQLSDPAPEEPILCIYSGIRRIY